MAQPAPQQQHKRQQHRTIASPLIYISHFNQVPRENAPYITAQHRAAKHKALQRNTMSSCKCKAKPRRQPANKKHPPRNHLSCQILYGLGTVTSPNLVNKESASPAAQHGAASSTKFVRVCFTGRPIWCSQLHKTRLTVDLAI
jgi:hypothetical protein